MNAETLIGGMIVALFASLAGALLGSKGKITREEFEKHRDSTHPHPSLPCEVHNERMVNMDKNMVSMDKKLDRLIEKLDA